MLASEHWPEKTKGQPYGKLSARPLSLKLHEQYRGCQSDINQLPILCRIFFACIRINPSRPCLTPECRFHLNQTRSLSYSYISPNQTCLPYILTFNPAPQPPKFPTFNLTWYQVPGTRFHAKKGQKPKKGIPTPFEPFIGTPNIALEKTLPGSPSL